MEKVRLFEAHKINRLKPVQDHIIVCDMEFDQKISYGGIWLPGTDGKLEGIHPRWGRVYAVGPDQKNIRVGQYVCVKHGRWTRGLDIDASTTMIFY
jgi:co-chaperonin GroES (HSP10)